MLLMLDGIKWIVIVVGTIMILFKAIPLISNISKEIGNKQQEKERLKNEEQKNTDEMSRASANLSQIMEQLVNVKCPDCGELIPPEDIRPVCYCSFCGRKVEIKESLIKEAVKYSSDEQNKKIELQKIQQAKRQNDRRTAIFVVLLIAMLAGLCIGLYHIWN